MRPEQPQSTDARDAPSERYVSPEELERALDGPPERRRAFAAWLLTVVDREVRLALRPFALRYRRDLRDAAEDLVQDVMLLLFHEDGRVLRAWDPARGMQLPSFISLVVRRSIFRRFKGFRGNPWSSDPTDATDLTTRLDDGITECPSLLADIEYRIQLDRVLSILYAELKERDWRMFIKLYVEECKPSQVGVEEGMKENAVHKWRSRFQQRVRELFESLERQRPHVMSASARGLHARADSPATDQR